MPGFDAIERNLHATLAAFAAAKPSGETRELAGVAVASSAVRYSMFNSAVLTAAVASPRELRQRIETAADFFAAQRLGWSFWLCQGWLESGVRGVVADIFDRCGLHEVAELPGMEAHELAPPARALPPLEFRRVCDATTRADFSAIMTVAFGLPPVVACEIYESEGTWGGGLTGWLGYSGDVAVTSAATLETDSAVGIYAVGTPPSHRRRGFAEAIVRHAVAEAGGERPSVLESSEAGLLLYRRLGYRTVTRYAVFAT
jgi:GNAT superfamily N-acetyltransferase